MSHKYAYRTTSGAVCCAGAHPDRFCDDCQAQHNKEKNMNDAPPPIDLAAKIRAAHSLKDKLRLTPVAAPKPDASVTDAAPAPIDLAARIRTARGM